MIRRHEIVVLAFSACIFLLLFAFGDGTSSVVNKSENDWKLRIEQIGGNAAYKELERSVQRLEESQKHLQAHLFGGAIYAAEGLQGLSTCDTQFSYGCFHEFLGRAISDLGIEAVKDLNQRCFEDLGTAGLACQHGIGHGIQAFYGYEEESLLSALKLCSRIAHIDPIGGCYTGVFMEYNFQTMLGEQGRVRKSHNVISPCDVVSQAHLEACVFSQPQWWHQSKLAVMSGTELFEQLGHYCDLVAPEDAISKICYSGIGNIAPQISTYKPDATRSACLATSEDSSAQLACLSTAANVIGVTTNIFEAKKVCRGLTDSALEYCLAYARNEANAHIKRKLPEV